MRTWEVIVITNCVEEKHYVQAEESFVDPCSKALRLYNKDRKTGTVAGFANWIRYKQVDNDRGGCRCRA